MHANETCCLLALKLICVDSNNRRKKFYIIYFNIFIFKAQINRYQCPSCVSSSSKKTTKTARRALETTVLRTHSALHDRRPASRGTCLRHTVGACLVTDTASIDYCRDYQRYTDMQQRVHPTQHQHTNSCALVSMKTDP